MTFIDETKKGARFWLPSVERWPGLPDTKGERHAPRSPRGHMRRMVFMNIIDPRNKKPTEIYGEGWFSNSEQVRELIKYAKGRLMFDPNEIVSKGILSADEMRSMGYNVTVESGVASAPDSSPLPEPIPDLNTMTKHELREFANSKGIFVDERMNKDAIVQKIKGELK